MNNPDTINASMTDAALAGLIAETAGKILLQIHNSGLFDGKALGKAGDNTANAFIRSALQHHRPQNAILSEEEKDSAARLAVSRV
jgi:3'(2'), 5'-bisphosphate nucleotidase